MAWNISKAWFSQNVNVSPDYIYGVFFKQDGTKMYFVHRSGGNAYVYEYILTTAWDLSTAVYVQRLDVYSEDMGAFGVGFKPDGTMMYVCGAGNEEMHEYTLSTAWDISTASNTSSATVGKSRAMFFKPDGTMLYVADLLGAVTHGYLLTTAWDISTLTEIQTLSPSVAAPCGIFIRPDGLKMYIIDDNRSVYEFNLTRPWDISTAVYLQSFTDSEIYILNGIFFKPDGTMMYVCGTGGYVNKYELSSSKHRPMMSS